MAPCKEKTFFLFLFLIFIYFFCLVHPAIPYNGDDWRYLSYARHAWPEAAEWNPARILPEVLLPAIGCMSAFLYKIGIDYISSVSIIYGIFLSTLLTVLAYNLYRLFCDILVGDPLGALLLTLFFMLSSFFMFEKYQNGNIFLFYATYFCTGIYYVSSNIINSILTLILFRYFLDSTIINTKGYSIPFLILLMYISQFSMTFSALISVLSAFFIFIFKCKNGLRACLETSAFIVTRRHVDKKRLCAAAKTREDCQTVPQRSDGQRMGACTSSPAPCFRRRSEAQNRPA